MAASPHTGRIHELTDEFVQKHPEAREWPTFRVGEVVNVKGQDFTIERITNYELRLKTLPMRNSPLTQKMAEAALKDDLKKVAEALGSK
ncbi:MAG: hypothetical protein MN733_08835 [Nitrososphaera sp.]|nr:hypothetical protein [Nitrososphaera sp.]